MTRPEPRRKSGNIPQTTCSQKPPCGTGDEQKATTLSLEKQTQLEMSHREAFATIRLVSQEIYSRFAAMLVSNTIVLTVFGMAVTQRGEVAARVTTIMPIAGLIICWLWFCFTFHGLYWHKTFRDKAIELESFIEPRFRILSLTAPRKLSGFWPRFAVWTAFPQTAYALIFVVASIHEFCLWSVRTSTWALAVGSAAFAILIVFLVAAAIHMFRSQDP